MSAPRDVNWLTNRSANRVRIANNYETMAKRAEQKATRPKFNSAEDRRCDLRVNEYTAEDKIVGLGSGSQLKEGTPRPPPPSRQRGVPYGVEPVSRKRKKKKTCEIFFLFCLSLSWAEMWVRLRKK